jgi:hypothetical protein
MTKINYIKNVDGLCRISHGFNCFNHLRRWITSADSWYKALLDPYEHEYKSTESEVATRKYRNDTGGLRWLK